MVSRADRTVFSRNHIVRAYIAYSRFMAVLAFALPVALISSSFTLGDGVLRSSLSDYYHGENLQRDYFVGTLCAVAAFLALYKGWRGWEAGLLNVAGVAAVLVALVPTPVESNGFVSGHGIAAFILFGCIVAVGVVLPFVREKLGGPVAPPLLGYMVSAGIMGVGAVLAVLGKTVLNGSSVFFWGEVSLVVGFGVFWWLRTRHLADPTVRPRLIEPGEAVQP